MVNSVIVSTGVSVIDVEKTWITSTVVVVEDVTGGGGLNVVVEIVVRISVSEIVMNESGVSDATITDVSVKISTKVSVNSVAVVVVVVLSVNEVIVVVDVVVNSSSVVMKVLDEISVS